MERVKRFFRAGLLLTVTAIATRTVGMLFSLYLSKKLGETGLGLFSLVMSVYSLAVTLSSAGIHLTTTKLVAEAIGKERPSEARAAARIALLFAFACGTAAGTLLFCFAESIGVHLLGDARTIPSLRILAPGLPFLSMGTALHGYFNGVRRIAPSTLSHLSEQAVRIAVTSALLSLFLPQGLSAACEAVVLGTCLSEIFSCLVAYLAYRRDCKQKLGHGGVVEPHLARRMLGITIPLALSSYLRSGLLTAEHIAIPQGLKKSGKDSDTALAAYGALQGMAFPLLLYPQAFIGSFAGLLMPEVAESRAAKKEHTVTKIATIAIRYALVFSLGTAAVMFALSHAFGAVLYHSETAAGYIHALAPLVPIMYLDGVTDSILKGMGEELYAMKVNILDAAASVALVLLLLPRYGVLGYILTVWICELLNFALSVSRLFARVPLPLSLRDVFLPLAAAVGAGALVQFPIRLLGAPGGYFSLAGYVLLVVVLFFLLWFLLGGARMLWVSGKQKKQSKKR